MKDSIYPHLLTEVKHRILSSQLKADLWVNAEIIPLYWNIGTDTAFHKIFT